MTYTFIRYKNYEEYLASNLGLDSHSRLLANGEVIELPPEDENNVRMASELDYLLKQVVKPRELVRYSSTELQVHPVGDQRVNRVPDVLVLRPEHIGLLAERKSSAILFEMPPPAFVAEIVSPGGAQSDNYKRDYHWKRQQYEWWQIPEYWIVDRHRNKVTALVLQGETYAEKIYQSGGQIQSAVFPKLKLSVAQVLAGREV
ncbi:MAG: Uma2 family endonuclease [Cyanobacteria bacterium P01_C01_bin.69]